MNLSGLEQGHRARAAKHPTVVVPAVRVSEGEEREREKGCKNVEQALFNVSIHMYFFYALFAKCPI